MAEALNVAVAPEQTVCAVGCSEIPGPCSTVTVSVLDPVTIDPPPPVTLAEFWIDVKLVVTLTVSAMTAFEPAAIGAVLVQTTSPLLFRQLHPVPLADTKPRPLGSISETVIVEEVAAVPLLLTVMEKLPF